MTKFLNFSLITQLLLVILFSYFGFQADLVMDKTGIGDINSFNKYNTFAGLSFYAFSGLWLLTIILIIAKKLFHQLLSKICIIAPPAVLVISWCVVLF